MYNILNYQDLKEYNEQLKSQNLPVIKIMKVSSHADYIQLSNSKRKLSLFDTIKRYAEAPQFCFEDVINLSKIDFSYYYALLHPKEAEKQLRETYNTLVLVGNTPYIQIGCITITLSNGKWTVIKATEPIPAVLYLPAFIEVICEEVFKFSESLRKVKSFAKRLSVKDKAFYWCRFLTEVKCTGGIDYVGSDAFKQCQRLQSIEFSKNLKEIGDEAFQACFKLSDVKVSEGLRKIGSYAFANCPMQFFKFPDSLSELGEGAFYNCDMLRDIDLNNTKITSVKTATFYDCRHIMFVRFPPCIKSIEERAFPAHKSYYVCGIPSTIEFIDPRCGLPEKDIKKYLKEQALFNAHYACEFTGKRH